MTLQTEEDWPIGRSKPIMDVAMVMVMIMVMVMVMVVVAAAAAAAAVSMYTNINCGGGFDVYLQYD